MKPPLKKVTIKFSESLKVYTVNKHTVTRALSAVRATACLSWLSNVWENIFCAATARKNHTDTAKVGCRPGWTWPPWVTRAELLFSSVLGAEKGLLCKLEAQLGVALPWGCPSAYSTSEPEASPNPFASFSPNLGCSIKSPGVLFLFKLCLSLSFAPLLFL